MDLVKRNAEIVALVKARKMPMREIAARYRLSTSSISLIAIRHGVHAQAADPKKVRAASKLIQRGMPLAAEDDLAVEPTPSRPRVSGCTAYRPSLAVTAERRPVSTASACDGLCACGRGGRKPAAR
jgi:hypothetical protein